MKNLDLRPTTSPICPARVSSVLRCVSDSAFHRRYVYFRFMILSIDVTHQGARVRSCSLLWTSYVLLCRPFAFCSYHNERGSFVRSIPAPASNLSEQCHVLQPPAGVTQYTGSYSTTKHITFSFLFKMHLQKGSAVDEKIAVTSFLA